MPSPVGHALAGAAVAFAAQPWLPPGSRALRRALVLAMLLAALPDVDLLHQPLHRAFSHSLGSTLLVMIIAAGVTRWVTRAPVLAIALLCAAAWGSHSLLDWLGADPTPPRGIKALWPFSDRWFISDWDLFRGTERRQVWTWASVVYNLKAVGQEVALLGPLTLALLAWRWPALRQPPTASSSPSTVRDTSPSGHA